MTGNNKVWRAPVAGLASAAMLATLGVTALTANAAGEETVTFDGNGLNFTVDGKSQGTYTFTSGTDDDGVINESDITTAEGALNGNAAGIEVVGWYTDPDIGEGERVNPEHTPAGTTVYAHWVDGKDSKKVKVSLGGDKAAGLDKAAFPTGLAAEVDTAGNVTTMDCISAWEMPVENAGGKTAAEEAKKILDHYEINAETVQDLNADLSGYVEYGSGNPTLSITAVPVENPVVVTFNGAEANGGSKLYTFKKDGVVNSVYYGLAAGESFSGRYNALPVAYYRSNLTTIDANTVVSAWALREEGEEADTYVAGDPFTLDTVVNGDMAVYANGDQTAYTVTFHDMQNNVIESLTQTVAKDAKATAPEYTLPDADAIDSDGLIKYTFDSWRLVNSTGTVFDFDDPITSDTALYASKKVSELAVQFDPNFGNESKILMWFADGDKFALPTDEPVRDGYVFDGWADNGKDASAFVGTTLTIDGTALKYMAPQNPGDAQSGSATTMVSLPMSFTADWLPVSVDTLKDVEAVTPKSLIYVGGVAGNGFDYDQTVFTDDSFRQFVSDYQDYLSAKSSAEKSGNVITNDEAAELIKQLSAAQDKLVFVADKTVMRFEKNGVHLYSDNQQEQDILLASGWKHEALGDFKTVDIARKGETLPRATVDGLLTEVSRLRNNATGKYMLTADQNEINVLTDDGSWKNETLSALYAPKNGTTPVQRFYVYSTGEHLVTIDANEYEVQTTNGVAHADGTKFYIY